MEEEKYYVNIREPAELRRNLLETSRQVILALQRYENFKLKRAKKHDLIDKLRSNFREINELIAKLKKELPQTKIARKMTFQREAKPAAVSIPKGRKEIADLEKELREIENKLRSLR
jgi:hypothetical protein